MPVLSHQNLVKIIRGASPLITGSEAITDEQIQMASVDLTLGYKICGMRTSALPRDGQSVQSLIDQFGFYSFDLKQDESKLLHRGQTYIVPLNERLSLPKGFSAKFSPKSSTGRIDVFVRVLADGVPRFDHVPAEYRGPLYLEITPLSWPIYVRARQPLVQMRIRANGGAGELTEEKLLVRHSNQPIVWSKGREPIPSTRLRLSGNGIFMHIDLDRDVVGFVARDTMPGEIDLSYKDRYEPDVFWEPMPRPRGNSIILCPGRFYLLATKERIKIPADMCGDIAPYDTSAGEFRNHYAGFFDPTFGGVGPDACGTVGVMEVRGREFPFQLSDGQPICRMDFELMDETPDIVYGANGVNHYTGAGPSLAKYFRRRQEVWPE